MNQQPEPEQELKPAALLWSIVRKLDSLHADLTSPPKPIIWLLGLIALLLGLVLWRVW